MAQTMAGEMQRTGAAPERRVTGPFVSFDIPFEIARVRADGGYEREGHGARTLAKYADLRVVLVAMKAGARMSLHETAERMTLQLVFGQCRLWFQHGENVELADGGFAAVDASLAHELECLEDCALLLTVAWPPASRSP